MNEPAAEKSTKPSAVGRPLTREEMPDFGPGNPPFEFDPREILDRLTDLEARVAALENT